MLGNDLHSATWRKSSYSGSNGACVEVAVTAPVVGIRDSKNPDAGMLTVSNTAWARFLTNLPR
jgi:Domain of unknown function (DUF397)